MAESGNFLKQCLVFILILILQIKDINGTSIGDTETKIIRVDYEPDVPILYQRLCMKPIYSVLKDQFLKKLWLADTKTNDTSKNTIYQYEKSTKDDTSLFGFFTGSSIINSFDIKSLNGIDHKVCITNLTKEETTTNLFIWKIETRSLREDFSPENFQQLVFTIDAAEMNLADREIYNLNISFTPVKPIFSEEFCLTLTYNIIPGYNLNELSFEVEEKSKRLKLYTFKKQTSNVTGISSVLPITDSSSLFANSKLMDGQKSKDSTVCFKRGLQYKAILESKYFWKIVIKNDINKYDLRKKEYPFYISTGAMSTTVAPRKKAGFPIGAIVGIVVAAVVIILITIIIIVWKKRNVKRTKRQKYVVANSNDLEKKQEELDDLETK